VGRVRWERGWMCHGVVVGGSSKKGEEEEEEEGNTYLQEERDRKVLLFSPVVFLE